MNEIGPKDKNVPVETENRLTGGLEDIGSLTTNRRIYVINLTNFEPRLASVVWPEREDLSRTKRHSFL
jgi:hypothetical protein